LRVRDDLKIKRKREKSISGIDARCKYDQKGSRLVKKAALAFFFTLFLLSCSLKVVPATTSISLLMEISFNDVFLHFNKFDWKMDFKLRMELLPVLLLLSIQIKSGKKFFKPFTIYSTRRCQLLCFLALFLCPYTIIQTQFTSKRLKSQSQY